jgi:hypothetical protein
MQVAFSYKEMAETTPVLRRANYRSFILVAYIFFFFNSLLLPDGLLYTILLTPVFLLWLKINKVAIGKYLFIYLVCWSFILIVHYSYGISLPEYLKSSVLYFTVFLFGLTIHTYFRLYSFTYESIMENVLKLNFFFVIICVALLLVDKKDIVWSVADISEGVSDYPRLKMFTYEPSYYSLLLIPSLIFYFQYIFYRTIDRRQWLILISIIISLGFSLSYGAIFISLLAISLAILFNFLYRSRRKENKRFIFLYGTLLTISIVLIFGLFANTAFVLRILNIFEGNDSSINNRSSQAYFLALKIADLKSSLFGVGPGQLKLLGQDIISSAYAFSPDQATGEIATARIPSSMAETLATFGYAGFLLKILIELILFSKTKVKTSSFRLCLFNFIFIYQFVGSFTTNIVEIFIWVLAFSDVFPDSYFRAPFDRRNNRS